MVHAGVAISIIVIIDFLYLFFVGLEFGFLYKEKDRRVESDAIKR
jgi:hypothetical protein